MTNYRKGLPVRPLRIMGLPLNEKGYPIPFFVEYVDGKPDFRVMSGTKWATAVQKRLCWVCGLPLGRFMTFVAGPMCGINRTTGEPPSHHDCAMYAAKACPFLTLPNAVRRDAGLPEERVSVGGIMLQRNPGVTMLWTCRDYKIHRVPNGVLIEMGDPVKLEWLAEGRTATREEVGNSIITGLPLLQAEAAKGGEEAERELAAMVIDFMGLIP